VPLLLIYSFKFTSAFQPTVPLFRLVTCMRGRKCFPAVHVSHLFDHEFLRMSFAIEFNLGRIQVN